MFDVNVCLDSILLNRVVPLNILRVSFTSEPVNLSLPKDEGDNRTESSSDTKNKNQISVETSSDGQRFHVLSLCGTKYVTLYLFFFSQHEAKKRKDKHLHIFLIQVQEKMVAS